MRCLCVFVGIAKSGANKGIYSLSLHMEDEILSLPVKSVAKESFKITDEYIAFTALDELLDALESEKAGPLYIRYFSGLPGLKKIWEEDGALYECITRIKDKAFRLGVSIEIEGDSVLNPISTMQSRKLKRRLSCRE